MAKKPKLPKVTGIAPVKPKLPGIKPNKNIDNLLMNAMGKNAGPVKPGRPKK